MKKNTLIYLIALVLIVVLISIFFCFKRKTEIKDTNEISRIVSDSNLDIILNLENFDENNYTESSLLEVAMLIAERKGQMNETDDGIYVQYVYQSDLHELINSLTGITVEAPIQIEDFYYLYDSENEYYFCMFPAPLKYDISEINHIYKYDDDIFVVECTASKTSDGELIEELTITTTLKLIEDNSYTNYQVINQTVS